MHINKALKIIIIIAICLSIIFVLPYFVWILYWIGEQFQGIPTYLGKTEMLSYLTSMLGLLASTSISVIALWQTQKIDDMSKAPNVVISEVENAPLSNMPGSHSDESYSFIHNADAICGKLRFSFRFQILEKSIEQISISKFIVNQLEGKKKQEIYNFPDSSIPGDSFNSFPFLQANSQVLVRYSTDALEPDKYYEAVFIARCKTMEGYWYEKECHMFFAYSIHDCITVKPIEGSAWKRCKRKKETDYGEP